MQVWLAECIPLQTQVAIKLMDLENFGANLVSPQFHPGTANFSAVRCKAVAVLCNPTGRQLSSTKHKLTALGACITNGTKA